MKGRNYRIPVGMPLTRKEYVPGVPGLRIAKFNLGNPKGDYDLKLLLVSKERAQIRQNALEAARVAINKAIKDVGDYYLVLRQYPHVILRENKMITTAGADRLQEGMRRAWGKPVNLAARVREGSVLFELRINSKDLEKAKAALKVGASKLPVPTRIEILRLGDAKDRQG